MTAHARFVGRQGGTPGHARARLRAGVIGLGPNAILAFTAFLALHFIPRLGSLAALLFLIAGLALILRAPGRILTECREQILLYCLVTWCVASVVWSDYPGLTLRYGVQLGLTFAIGIAMASRMPPLTFLKSVTLAYLLAALASLAFGRDRSDGLGFLGIYNSKNALASVCTVLLIAGATLLMDRRLPARWRGAGLASVIIAGLLLLRAQSTGAIVASIGSAVVLIVLVILARLAPKGRLVVTVVGLLIAGLGMIAIVSNAEALTRAFLDTTGKDITLTGRTDLWAAAFAEIAQRPILGAGFQAVWVVGNPLAEQLWSQFGIATKTGFHFHNALISNAVEIGIPGAGLQAVLILAALWRLIGWSLRDPRAETLFLTVVLVRQVLLSLVEVTFFTQFDPASLLTVAAIVYAARARSEGR